MATILEAGLLQNFSIIFSMILVIAIVYSILTLTKMLGENKAINALIAFIIGLMLLLSPKVSQAISITIPWFILLFIGLLFLLMTYKLFGATEADFLKALKFDRTIIWVIIIVFIIIFVGALSSVYSQEALTKYSGAGPVIDEEPTATGAAASFREGGAATGSFSQNFGATLFHPKVLGMILILLVAVFTIAILSAQSR